MFWQREQRQWFGTVCMVGFGLWKSWGCQPWSNSVCALLGSWEMTWQQTRKTSKEQNTVSLPGNLVWSSSFEIELSLHSVTNLLKSKWFHTNMVSPSELLPGSGNWVRTHAAVVSTPWNAKCPVVSSRVCVGPVPHPQATAESVPAGESVRKVGKINLSDRTCASCVSSSHWRHLCLSKG